MFFSWIQHVIYFCMYKELECGLIRLCSVFQILVHAKGNVASDMEIDSSYFAPVRNHSCRYTIHV